MFLFFLVDKHHVIRAKRAKLPFGLFEGGKIVKFPIILLFFVNVYKFHDAISRNENNGSQND